MAHSDTVTTRLRAGRPAGSRSRVTGLRAFLAYVFFVHRQRRAKHPLRWTISPEQVRRGYAFFVLAGLSAWGALWVSGTLGLPGDQAGLLMGLFSILGLIFFPRPILRQVEFLTEGKGSKAGRAGWLHRTLGRLEVPLRFRLRRRSSVGLRTRRR
ncbi:MAG: hypothetical protein J2P59_05515 [Acidimicrobiales bacterium]|nr:hypothetical protein [Acidimicrobiales bacterium]